MKEGEELFIIAKSTVDGLIVNLPSGKIIL